VEDSEKEIIGEVAEKKFKEWLDKHKIPYFYIQQDSETFSQALKNLFSGKRPDFIVLLPNFGLIFVDVKYKRVSKDFSTFPIDS